MDEEEIEQIINALDIIKSTCKQATNCDKCVLGSAECICMLKQVPQNWIIDSSIRLIKIKQ